jgi:hypothetical protein
VNRNKNIIKNSTIENEIIEEDPDLAMSQELYDKKNQS